jgi:hypothetical protein
VRLVRGYRLSFASLRLPTREKLDHSDLLQKGVA